MTSLIKKINKIKKSFFSFADLRKIAGQDDASLRVAISRLIKQGELIKLAKGYYSVPGAAVDAKRLALEIYRPSYLSFEWVLSESDILSQKTYSLTLATVKRARRIEAGGTNIVYRHIQPDLFFGYTLRDGYLVADPEKAYLDLAYLSLNGYAKFDREEMNLKRLDKKKIALYFKKIKSKKLEKLKALVDF